MGLDIRWPVGLLFVIFGVLLAAFGLVSDPALYARSLGRNVNLWWGLTMVAFGAVMLGLAARGRSGRRGGERARSGREVGGSTRR
jgi:hypothetical protein